jgi:hypothetical protein
MSIMAIELLPDMAASEAVEETPEPRNTDGSTLHRGHSRTCKARAGVRPNTRCAAII